MSIHTIKKQKDFMGRALDITKIKIRDGIFIMRDKRKETERKVIFAGVLILIILVIGVIMVMDYFVKL